MKKLIGLCGVARSGKSTVGEYLQGKYAYHPLAFATPIKQALSRICGWDMALLNGEKGDREAVDPMWGFSPRQAMQHLGASMRGLAPTIWLLSTMQTVRRLNGAEVPVCITDVRHHNEVDAIHEAGGVVWRCHRQGAGLAGEKALHESEVHVPELSVDLELDNNGTLDELWAQVDREVQP